MEFAIEETPQNGSKSNRDGYNESKLPHQSK